MSTQPWEVSRHNNHVLYNFYYAAVVLGKGSRLVGKLDYSNPAYVRANYEAKDGRKWSLFIERITVRPNVVHVVYFNPSLGRRWSTFVSKADFLKLMTKQRKLNSQSGLQGKWNQSTVGLLNVHSERSHQDYNVQFTINGVTCECADWKNQIQQVMEDAYLVKRFGLDAAMMSCKHGYFALKLKGFQSVMEYRSNKQTQTA